MEDTKLQEVLAYIKDLFDHKDLYHLDQISNDIFLKKSILRKELKNLNETQA